MDRPSRATAHPRKRSRVSTADASGELAPASIGAAQRRILEGPLPWEVLRFGAPLMIGMVANVLFNLVDAYLIARLPDGVAGPSIGAVGICDQIAAIGTIMSYGLSTATAAIVSQRKGAGDALGVRRAGWQSLLLTGGLSIAFGLAGVLLAGPMIRDVVGAKGEVARLAVDYLRVIVGGSFSIFFLLQLTSIMRALGSSKTPVAVLLGGNVVNLLLAILLVYGQGPRPALLDWSLPLARAVHAPRLELVGAAWATVIARSLALIPAIVWLAGRRFGRVLRPRREWLLPLRRELAAIWAIGWPSSAQFVVRIGAFVATSALVAHAFTSEADQTASTAYGVIFRVETMALFVSMGWGSAAQTFTGTCKGAGLLRRGGRSGWWAAGYDAMAMALLAWLVIAAAGPILGFFDHDPAVLAIGREYLRVVAPSYVTYGAAIVLGNAFSGVGETRRTFKLDMLIVLLVQLPLSALAVKLAAQTRTPLWSAIAAANAISLLLYAAAYARADVFWGAAPTER